jgi:hypothetical protein
MAAVLSLAKFMGSRSALFLGHKSDLGQAIEMPVAGQQIRAMAERGGIDDGICRREFMAHAKPPATDW